MNKILFFLITLGHFQSISYSQTSELNNFSVSSADLICNRAGGKSPFNANPNYCINNKTNLYYYFSPTQDHTLGTTITPNYDLFGISSSYVIYGPFSSSDDYATLIGTNSAPIVNSETGISSYPKNIVGSVYANKIYIVKITINACSGTIQVNTQTADFPCSYLPPCEDCLPKFQPVSGKYIISAWVKENSSLTSTTYTNGHIDVKSGTNSYSFFGQGQIIDGWQRIEGIINTNNIGEIKVELKSNNGTVYFDDIRIFPIDGSMITYVYDPLSLKLVAELDERNYAKKYEYNEEGELIRVKKETEKGIMTIQENRNNTHGQ